MSLLRKTGKKLEEIDLFEINEAFAAVALVSGKIAGLDPEKVNVNGGAVALGHPIGASGARIIITLMHELKRRGGGIGIAAICSGGGQGDAVMIEVPSGLIYFQIMSKCPKGLDCSKTAGLSKSR